MTIDSKHYTQGSHWPDKGVEALGVVSDLLESMELNGEEQFHSPIIYEHDPPDCIAKDNHGNDVGIEVTALIDKEEVEKWVKGEYVYRGWGPDEVIKEITGRMAEKDKKAFNGGPYARKILVFHTHSPIIQSECLSAIKNHKFHSLEQIDDVYIKFDYDASIRRHPYIQLQFDRQ